MPVFRLETAKSATFRAELFHGRVDDNGKVKFVVGQDFFVQAAHPNLINIQDTSTREKFHHGQPIILTPFPYFISDGKNQLELNRPPRVYVMGAAASTLDTLAGKEGLPFLLHTDLLFAPHVVHDFDLKYAGKESIRDTEVAVFKSGLTGPVKQQYVIYIASQTGLPARVSIFQQDDTGQMREDIRTDYTDWKLDVSLPASTFDTTPPPNTHPMPPEEPKYDPKWKPGQSPAPLLATALDGSKVALAKYKNRVVLLDYWASWCGPCLEETPSVVKMYQRLHAQGLEIVGISLNTEAQRKQLSAYLKTNALPWPLVCDGKGFSSSLAKAYEVNAIPFNILIGRDGKIVAIDVHGEELESAIRKALATK